MKYQQLWVLVAVGAICACRAYDESLLPPRTARSNQRGAAGTGASGSSGETAGASGQSEPSPGGGAETHCGNGRLEADEKCDTGIPSDTPGACPTLCGTTESCQLVQLTGSGCSLECHVIERNCQGGDGCCPAKCKAAEDSDCSGQCGDGIVQTDKGETCEPKPRNGASPCPVAADCDDDDACTTDALTGSAENCNATCKHTKVTSPQGGDGCCPSGANANSDSDCKPVCGNGAREGDEACDGTTGCDAMCKLTLTEQQIMCLDTLAETSCERCECMSCAEAKFGCSKSGDASRDQACTMVETCAITERCAGSACYCGTAAFGLDCVYRANGPCKEIIEAAAGTTSATRIDAMYRDPETVLGRAQALGNCRRAQCVNECK